VLLADNPRLVYGRMTGWGQTGPLANTAGHDINYIALSGALNGIGPAGGKPVVPLNLIGDFGGGGMMLAFAMVSAILSTRETGEGQVIDCAMTDGSALLTTMMWSMVAQGRWVDERGANLLDGAAHFYDTYETADAKAVALGPIEPQFYGILLERLGLADDPAFKAQMDRGRWVELRSRLSAIFKTRSRDEWTAVFEGSDACFAPVLSMREAANHPHNLARSTFVEVEGITQPAPAPRYSRTVNDKPTLGSGAALETVLASIGYDEKRIDALRRDGVIGQARRRSCPA
jgi:alpha-methylacyl-CoA racemase